MRARSSLIPVLCCLGGAMLASGCSQGPWGWGKAPSQDISANAGATPAGGLDLLPSGGRGDDKMPKNPLALARLSERRGQIEQAERLYQEVIKKSPNNPAPFHRLAVMYAKRGKMQQAEENFVRALSLKADDPELLGDAGYFYYLTGRPQQAEQHLRRAMELEPGNKRYCTNLALTVGEQGRRDEAHALFRRSGSEIQANANLAFVLTQRGEYQQALELYDRALTADPSMRVAADAMIELSKLTPSKPSDRPASPPGEGRPALASYAPPASSAKESREAADESQSLVTITDGRPVPPPGRFREEPVRDPPEPPSGMACAFATPNGAASLRRTPPPDEPAQAAAPLPMPQAVAVQPGPADSESAAQQAPTPAARETWEPAAPPSAAPSWRTDSLAFAAVAGVLFLGIGFAPMLRRRRPPRAAEASHAIPRGTRGRSGRRRSRERGVALRIRPLARRGRRTPI